MAQLSDGAPGLGDSGPGEETGNGESARGGAERAEAGGATAGSGEAARKVTVAEVARDWGTSAAYVSKQVNKKGCPLSSLEAAREWRAKNSKYGVGYRSKKAPAEKGAAGGGEAAGGEAREEPGDEGSKGDGSQAPGSTPVAAREENVGKAAREEPVVMGKEGGFFEAAARRGFVAGGHGFMAGGMDFGTIEGSLAAAIEVERQAFEGVQSATPSEKGIRIQDYNKARAGRLEAEERVLKLLQERKELVTVDFAKALIRRVVLPLVTRMRSMSQRAAIRVNPMDDLHAKEVLDEEVETAIGEARAEV